MKRWIKGAAALLASLMLLTSCNGSTSTKESTTTGSVEAVETTQASEATTEATSEATTETTTETTTEATTETTTESTTEEPESETSSDATPAELPTEDRAGNKLELKEAAQTIAVMAPAYAQIVEGLEATDRIVAVDVNSSTVSPDFANLPQMDLFAPNSEILIELKPALVIASSISKAGGEDDPFQQIEDAGIPVAYLETPTTLADIADDIRFIADCMGLHDEGQTMAEDYLANIETLTEIGKRITERKTALFEVAPAPEIYSFGKDVYLHEMMDRIGLDNVLGDQSGWLPVTEEAALAANPQVIFTASNWLEDPVKDITDRAAWSVVDAVKNDAVHYIENAHTQLPSQKVVDGMLAMGQAAYPDAYKDVTLR